MTISSACRPSKPTSAVASVTAMSAFCVEPFQSRHTAFGQLLPKCLKSEKHPNRTFAIVTILLGRDVRRQNTSSRLCGLSLRSPKLPSASPVRLISSSCRPSFCSAEEAANNAALRGEPSGRGGDIDAHVKIAADIMGLAGETSVGLLRKGHDELITDGLTLAFRIADPDVGRAHLSAATRNPNASVAVAAQPHSVNFGADSRCR